MKRHIVLACTTAATALVVLPAGAQEPPAWRLTQDLRIDAATQDLTPITYLAVAPNGTIAVAQYQDGLIRFFDEKGTALGTFGRKGQGPGEFQTVGRFSWLSDTLVVGDLQTRRFTIIAPDRKLVRTVLWLPNISGPARSGGPAPAVRGSIPRLLLADRSQVITASVPDGGTAPEWLGAQKGTPILHADSTGALRRVIAWIPSSDECSVRADFASGGYAIMRIPYCPIPQEEAATQGSRITLAYAERGKNSYRVEVVRINGDTVFARSYPYVPVRIPEAARDSARASRMRGAPEMQAAAAKMQLPDAYPPLLRVLPGRDETTWLELYTRDGERIWQVLDARGNIIGRLKVPRTTEIKVASSAMLWVTETDDDGLQHVVRFRVSR